MLNRLAGMGIGEEEMEGTIPVVPCKISGGVTKEAARKTIFTISSGKTSRLNCPGRQALVPQILSPVLDLLTSRAFERVARASESESSCRVLPHQTRKPSERL